MRLEELLQYDDIMIQCHDDPEGAESEPASDAG